MISMNCLIRLEQNADHSGIRTGCPGRPYLYEEEIKTLPAGTIGINTKLDTD